MNKLLSMELKRAAKSPILWLGVIAVIAINVYGILLNGYGFKIFTTTFLLENSDLICIILAVLIPLYLGSDFENRTINNKISAGYTRKEIYIVELIVSSICATVLFVADILSVFTSSNIAGLEFSDKVNVTEFAFHAAIAFVCIITVSALYTIPFMKAVCKKPYHIICLVLNKTFRKCNNKLPPFNTFPCCSACFKIQLILSGKILPELWCCSLCLIGRIKMFLSFRIGNIINSSCHIRQLVLSDK